VKKKVARAKSARSLPSEAPSAKQAKSIKGGGSASMTIPRLKWEALTLKKG
jgi:hypothetical protein